MKQVTIMQTLAMTALTLSMAGCMSTSSNVDNAVDLVSNPQYVVDMPKASIMPSQAELKGQRARVLLLPIKNEAGGDWERGSMREVAAKLDEGLNAVGAESVDRNLARKLSEEIMAYEATGQFSGSGVELADFAILASIGNSQLNSNFSPASSYVKDNKTVRIPAKCTYNATMSGSIKLYKMPDLSIVDAINLNGNDRQVSQSNNRNCPISKATASSLLSKAAGLSIFKAMPEVQKHLIQTGYVLQYRKREDAHLVQINMGINHGIKKGQRIEFVRKLKNVHPITKQVTISEIPYDFQGIVTQLVEADLAWVSIEEEAQGQLHFGDVARQLVRKKTWFDEMLKKASD